MKQIKIHYFFILHGYKGSPEDMEDFAGVIAKNCPNSRIHWLKKIEEVDDKGIFELGEIIADEIRFEIDKQQVWFERSDSKLTKITFIGHSLGGLVLRASLSHLEDFKSMFHGFVTLATPHTGYIQTTSRLLSIGMWAVSAFSGNPSIGEIRLSDAKDIQECALYKLSKSEGLDWFKYVILAGSCHDAYAPIESALIQASTRTEDVEELRKNIYEKLKSWKVIRASIDFSISDVTIDSFIGRTGHLQFLENIELLQTIVTRYQQVFKDF